ncbi:hypothetical protein RG47T_3459 [Mucilaginibacter polytrichastri]|uniref:DUF5683 domain-containing protein n=2 Tax=Mucilaginibacter polytrichastri TaxID=1302689 RepID=A0A1Q6A1U6_9SPHI|nr:hypothetical protein RG47T_3459 [Mucilaginibacter polytrichastri]
MALSFNAMAQKPDFGTTRNSKDSLNRSKDSVSSKPFVPNAFNAKVYHPDSLHSPHKAFIRSAILPGWGQVYNRKYWKLPIIYGGFTLLGIAIVWNHQQYNIFIKEAKIRRDGGVSTGPYKNSTASYQDFFDAAAADQRNLQLSILGVVGVWGINCIDAYIDAKFIHSYSVDNNLTIKVAPTMLNQPVYAINNNGYIPGIKLTLGF